MKAMVDPDICIGCTICTQDCLEIFKMINDKAVSCVTIVPSQFEEAVRNVAAQCPVNAIMIEE